MVLTIYSWSPDGTSAALYSHLGPSQPLLHPLHTDSLQGHRDSCTLPKEYKQKKKKNGYKTIFEYLTKRGLRPNFQIMDNKCPQSLKDYITEQNITFQLVPPHYHRNNPAENTIGTWREHFSARITSTDPSFPLHIWYRIVEQCTTTLNLLHPSNINPKLSAEAQLNGAFDFNQNPMAPPMYKRPRLRNTKQETCLGTPCS